MKALEDKILKEGEVYPGNVLKVGSFLNHCIDVPFICECGKEFFRLFDGCGVNKILTVEASGIAVAVLTAQYFGCPAVFAKKAKTSNIADDVYSAPVKSYTHNCINQVMIEKKYLNPGDKVLVIDDFLAHGEALTGLFKLIEDAGAEVVGAGIVIEKAFQDGGKDLRKRGFRIESLARISGMDAETGSISFIN